VKPHKGRDYAWGMPEDCLRLTGSSPSIPEKTTMLLPAFVDGKYGYIDENGRMAIDPIFDQGNSFQDDRALVRVEQRFGYISPDGVMAIDPIFEDADSFREGCAEVTYEGGRYLIDTEGDILSELAYDNHYSISEGLLCVNLGGRDVEIEEHGFKQLVTEGGRWGYVDRYGSFVLSPKYLHAMPFSDGLAHVVIEEPGGQHQSCYIDHAGAVVFKASYDHCGQFHEGFAGVEYDGKRGYIDSRGVLVIGTGLDGGFHFSEGLASVCKNKRWGYIDQTGTYVIKPRFPDQVGKLPPSAFREGLACVWAETGYGFIDRTGKLVIPPIFPIPAFFEGGLAGRPKEGYIDRTGHFLWRPGNS